MIMSGRFNQQSIEDLIRGEEGWVLSKGTSLNKDRGIDMAERTLVSDSCLANLQKYKCEK